MLLDRAKTSLLPRARLDLGQLLARVLCALFAVIGALPLGGGFLARTDLVRSWASEQTALLTLRGISWVSALLTGLLVFRIAANHVGPAEGWVAGIEVLHRGKQQEALETTAERLERHVRPWPCRHCPPVQRCGFSSRPQIRLSGH